MTSSAGGQEPADELLDPNEVAVFQVSAVESSQKVEFSQEAGVNLPSVAGSAVTTDVSSDSSEKQEKVQRWIEQRDRTAELSLRRYRWIGYGLLILVFVAITSHFFGYRFLFLDGIIFPSSGGLGVFYFVVVGILSSFLIAYTWKHRVPRANLFAWAMSLILLVVGFGSFRVAQWVDARQREELAASAARDVAPDMESRSPVVIQKSLPAGTTPSHVKGGLVESKAKKKKAGLEGSGKRNPVSSSSISVQELDPVKSMSSRSQEAFRPREQATDFSVDQIVREAKEKPFKSLNAAALGVAVDSKAVVNGRSFDIPRPDAVRDLLGYPAKRDAMLQRKKDLLPLRIVGGEIREPASFASFQISKIAGRQTKFGFVYFRDQPCIGLDGLKVSTASEAALKLILPIYDKVEFSDSLCHKPGFYLTGIKVNVKGQEVVGVQALLAPTKNDQLDMEKSVVTDWFGQGSAGQQFRVIADSNHAVYGIVVYEEKLKITGIGLVQKK